MKPNAGAFPVVKDYAKAEHIEDGLSIRDYIAIEAMKSLIVIQDRDQGIANLIKGSTFPLATAHRAYEFADALIAESNKKHE